MIYRTVTGALTWGTLQFLAGAIAGTSSNIQNVFSTFSSIADQSLFLTDLVEFLEVGPKICSKPDAIPAPRPIRDGFLFEQVTFAYPGNPRRVLDRLDLRIWRPASASRLSARTGRERPRSSSCSRACTIPLRAASCSTASICATTTWRICRARSA